MIVSWNWLTQYVRLDMPVEALTERLALTGLNHESTTETGGDLAIDLEVTSNRPDCLGHLGVAREISVLFDIPMKVPDPKPRTSGPAVTTRTSIAVEAADLCPRFTGRVVTGATIGDSPWWLRKRLETLGIRPVSNVVDVTNYVMFECGQPLHAYDLDRLAGRRLVVRRSRPGETIRAINNKDYPLAPDMIVIADAERPVGVAGVMGGAESEINASTRNILIEAAQFDSLSIRRTARALGLHSPSSYRFERPLDPNATEWASRRCAELILEVAGGKLHPGVIDIGAAPPERPPITLRLDQIARTLGIAIDPESVVRILDALGLSRVEGRAGDVPGTVTYRPPSWRSDLEREIDLIEEVARIHGYEHIPEDRAVAITSTPRACRERVEDAIRNALTGAGFDEAITFSLVAESLAAPLEAGSQGDPGLPAIRVEHSSRRRENALRQSLIPSLLAVRRHNEAHGNADAELFEIANVYRPRRAGSTVGSGNSPLPDEPTRLALVSGRDFFGLKGVIEALLERLHALPRLEVRPATLPFFTAGHSAELLLGGTRLGYLGIVATSTRGDFELHANCSAAELDFATLEAQAELVPTYRPLPMFPAVVRDLSLVVSQALPWSDLARVVTQSAGPSLEAIEYLDTFRGGTVPEGKQSLHFGLRFRHPSRTLTGEEVDDAMRTIIDACADRVEATLRV
jgi:phenylalanyl-tRNA synthetase beta chain